MTVPEDSEAEVSGQSAAPASAVGRGEISEAEFAAFYETNVDKLTTYLTRFVGRDDALILVGQVFEQFFVWWPANPCHPAPRATLYRIANCRAADHLRRNGRSLTVEAGDLEKALLEGEHADGFAAVELRTDLERALAELSERQRQALVLRYLAGLPVKECAAVLGQGHDNMKKILKKALQTLRTSPRMDTYEPAGWAEEVHR